MARMECTPTTGAGTRNTVVAGEMNSTTGAGGSGRYSKGDGKCHRHVFGHWRCVGDNKCGSHVLGHLPCVSDTKCWCQVPGRKSTA